MILALVVSHTLSTYGYAAVFAAVALESLGLPMPGETTLVAAAVFAGTTHRLSIVTVVAVAIVAAISGDNAGYFIGRIGGARLIARHGHRVGLTSSRRKMLRYLFDRHGRSIVFAGRFVLILRTYAALLAGTSGMRWRSFLIANALGGIAWAASFGIAGYEFGNAIKTIGTTLSIVLGALALVGVAAGSLALRHFAGEIERRAEIAYPDSAPTLVEVE